MPAANPRVWLVTGSSRGLGLAIATAALDSGDSVIATARKTSDLQHLVDKYGHRVFPLALDVSKNEEVVEVVEKGCAHFNRIDVVVNNAGYANTAAVEDIEVSDFEAQINTNLLGVFYVSKAVSGLSAYQAAKWAVGGFSTVLSKEVAPLGIKVTVLEPRGIRTDWAGSSMAIPPVSEPYQQTVGAFAAFLRSSAGTEPSIPSRIAAIILRLLDQPEPPLRILIGPDEWREVSLSSAEHGTEVDRSVPL
ncbi:hypothetical protein AAT19DRAFT_9581 [Rhodotorula toruloides]|uniref:Short-chain dehydrogenase/reductase SDR family protein n=1 Tax=Rhodotorula toruloides TaxID=5286 RepID=A0A0K3CIQ3_RHOTO|nr:hypothetical protein AAT19DRAFT_9581 [Rhodotorula toruloides]